DASGFGKIVPLLSNIHRCSVMGMFVTIDVGLLCAFHYILRANDVNLVSAPVRQALARLPQASV
ncbi:MAG: hypothetical protein AAF485_18740, partial [Chloroflexota bacterium]